MHASKPCQRKKLASPGLLTKKNEPFRIITVFEIAKALSEGPKEPEKKLLWRQAVLKLKLKFINRVDCACLKANILI